MSGPPGWPVNSLLSTLTRTGRYWKLGGENQQFTPSRGPWRVTPLSWSFMEWKCSERHRNHDNLQVWYTGNYAIASPLSRKKEWFRELFRIGPSLGYHPNPEKSFVIMYYENIYIYIYIWGPAQDVHFSIILWYVETTPLFRNWSSVWVGSNKTILTVILIYYLYSKEGTITVRYSCNLHTV